MADQIPTYSTDPNIQKGLAALYGQSGDVNAKNADGTPLTAAQKTGAQTVYDQRQSLFNQNAAYQTNQNLGNMYGITQAPAQNQFLTDFNTAVGFDPTTSANLMKGMSDPTTLANMNKEIGNSNFHYTGEATAHPNIPYQLNPSEQFIKSLVEANTASPGKGSGNAIMNQFVGNSSAVGNPFLGEYTWGGTAGAPVRKDANGNPIQSIGALTSQQLTDLRNGAIPSYTTAAQSKNNVGDVFLTQNGIVSQETDSNGYTHIVSGGNEYLINPISKRIISITPIKHASGGTVGMPQEYSRGNWKLI